MSTVYKYIRTLCMPTYMYMYMYMHIHIFTVYQYIRVCMYMCMCVCSLAKFTEEQYKQSMRLLEDIQRLEREKNQLEFTKHQALQRKDVPKQVSAMQQPVRPEIRQDGPVKMCLRKRYIPQSLQCTRKRKRKK